jgi:DNA polymerase-3 subunit gamma/tau
MAYLVLARKYRPQAFDEVVGQAHVTRILENAIRGGRVAHAILFSGPRGTGKTTIARILAKAMNCESGPTTKPCNDCRSCRDITAGRAVDVFEIDGASNNSVDQVRELRDNCRYMPAHSRHKIYIIDEVHMLSIAAFNALLKTLEEPPAHVMFLFATTEAHKIPITILSRCQRHDLRRIDLKAVSRQMEAICREESVSVSPADLLAIARQSGGSMRDALSLLDQVLACSDGRVEDNPVVNLLGGMDRQVLFDISAAVFAGDISRILAHIDAVFSGGQDMKRFYSDLLMHFRHLILVKMNVQSDLLGDLSPGEIEMMAGQVQTVSIAFIDQVLTLLFNTETSIRHASQPRLAVEIAFFKIHQITPALPIDELIDRLERLMKAVPSKTPPGVVEAQSDYGNSAMPLPVAAPSRPVGGEPATAISPSAEAPQGPSGGTAAAEPDGEDGIWERIVARIAETKPSIGAALGRSQLVSATGQALEVTMRVNDYSNNIVKKHLPLIEAVCRELSGRELRIVFSGEATDAKQAAAARQQADDIRQQLLNHPLLADAVDIFNGKIEEIKIR